MSEPTICGICKQECWARMSVMDRGTLTCSRCWALYKDGRALRDSMVVDLGGGVTMPAADYLEGMADVLGGSDAD